MKWYKAKIILWTFRWCFVFYFTYHNNNANSGFVMKWKNTYFNENFVLIITCLHYNILLLWIFQNHEFLFKSSINYHFCMFRLRKLKAQETRLTKAAAAATPTWCPAVKSAPTFAASRENSSTSCRTLPVAIMFIFILLEQKILFLLREKLHSLDNSVCKQAFLALTLEMPRIWDRVQ